MQFSVNANASNDVMVRALTQGGFKEVDQKRYKQLKKNPVSIDFSLRILTTYEKIEDGVSMIITKKEYKNIKKTNEKFNAFNKDSEIAEFEVMGEKEVTLIRVKKYYAKRIIDEQLIDTFRAGARKFDSLSTKGERLELTYYIHPTKIVNEADGNPIFKLNMLVTYESTDKTLAVSQFSSLTTGPKPKDLMQNLDRACTLETKCSNSAPAIADVVLGAIHTAEREKKDWREVLSNMADYPTTTLLQEDITGYTVNHSKNSL